MNKNSLDDVIEGPPARHWHALEDGRIQCDLCPRLCRLHDGQRGLCFVRARRGEEIFTSCWVIVEAPSAPAAS